MGSVRVLFSTGRPKRGKFVDTCSNRVVPNSYFYKICLGPVGRKFVCLRFWARKQSIQCRRSFCLWKQANTGVHPLLLKEARCICLFNQQTKWFTVTSKINRDWLVHISWLLASRCNGRLIEVWVHSSLSFIAGLPDWHAWNCCNHSIWSQISALQHLGPRANQTTEAPAVRWRCFLETAGACISWHLRATVDLHSLLKLIFIACSSC